MSSNDRARLGTLVTRDSLTLGAIFLAAAALRLWGLHTQSLTMDELAELRIAQHTPAEIIRVGDGFPPLYHLALHYWLQPFSGDEAPRWLALVLGLATVIATWHLARIVTDRGTATASALLAALSPLLIWYSQEGRAYTLYALCAVATMALLFRALSPDSRARDWALYATASVIGAYTHYYFVVLLALTAAIGAIEVLQSRRRARIAAWLITHLGMSAAAIPLLWLLRLDMGGEASAPFAVPFQPVAVGYALYAFLAGFSLGPSLRELHTATARQAIDAVLGWGIPLAIAATLLLWHGVRAVRPPRWAAYLVALAVVPPVASVLLAGALSVTFQVRHVLWAAIPVLILLAAGVRHALRRPPLLLATAVLVAASLVAVAHRQLDPRYWNEEVRAVANYLDRTGDRTVPVFVTPGYMTDVVQHYLGDAWAVDSLDGRLAGDGNARDPLEVLARRASARQPYWLVYSRPFHGDQDGRIRSALTNHAVAEVRATFAGVVLYAGGQQPPVSDSSRSVRTGASR